MTNVSLSTNNVKMNGILVLIDLITKLESRFSIVWLNNEIAVWYQIILLFIVYFLTVYEQSDADRKSQRDRDSRRQTTAEKGSPEHNSRTLKTDR